MTEVQLSMKSDTKHDLTALLKEKDVRIRQLEDELMRVKSEHRNTENQLRQLFRAVDQSHSSIVITDLNGNIEYVNPAFCQTTGYSQEEALGANPRILKSGQHPPEFYRQMWDILSRGEVWAGELINKKKDGTLYWESAVISPVKNKAGEVTHYLTVKEDITRRKRMEQDLMMARARFEGILNTAHDAIITIDRQRHITLFNDGAVKIFGYLPGEIVNGDINALIPEEYHPAHNVHIQEFGTETDQARRMCCRNLIYGRRKNGEIFPAEASISKLTLADQIHFTVILRDVTDRVALEETLINRNAELEAVNQQLRQLNEEKNEFLGIVSHDLKTPLNGILGYVQLLQNESRQGKAEQFERFLTEIEEIGKQMITLISNLLDVNKIESGRMELKIEPVNLCNSVYQKSKELRPIARNKDIGLHFTCHHSNGPPVIMADQNALSQICDNLISNALKFSRPRTQVQVNLETDDQLVTCSVRDEGPGLSESDLPRLFTKFARLSAKPTGGENSTGLGLSIVKKLVAAMSGEIWAANNLDGPGCTFFVRFPRLLETLTAECLLQQDIETDDLCHKESDEAGSEISRAAAGPDKASVINPDIVTPARHHLTRLSEFSAIGDIKGIETYLNRLDAESSANREFTRHFRQLCSSFRIDVIEEELSRLLQHTRH